MPIPPALSCRALRAVALLRSQFLAWWPQLVEVDGRRLVFEVEASDGVDVISRGRHERFVIDADRFARKASEKAALGRPA